MRTVDVLRRGGDGGTCTANASRVEVTGSDAKCACLREAGEYLTFHDEGDAAGPGVVFVRVRSANESVASLETPLRETKNDVRLGLRVCARGFC